MVILVVSLHILLILLVNSAHVFVLCCDLMKTSRYCFMMFLACDIVFLPAS